MSSKHKEEAAVVLRDDLTPAMLSDFAKDAGVGFEDMGSEDYALPFIILLQSQSPQLQEDNALYNEAARPGWMINTVTGEAFKDTRVIPCAYAFRVNERKPREAGGGFVARHERDRAPQYTMNDFGKKITATGNELIDTAYHYVMVLDNDGIPSQAVMVFRSTQLSKSKKWNAKMAALKLKDGQRLITPPMYSSVYVVTSGKESNEKGSWFGYVIEREGYVEDRDLLNMCREFSRVALGKKLADEGTEKAQEPADEVM